ARAALQAAEAGVALAQARLQKATLKAPLSGVVGLRSVSVGAYVTPGERIVELADIDPIKVDFRVPELSLSALRPGQPIRVTVDALPGKSFDGEIDAIDPIVDVSGRAVRLRARIPNARGELSPGLFARVQIVLERRENSVLVRESAVFAEGRKRFVYRVIEGRAVLTEVELGQRRPGEVEIFKGLRRGDIVVTAGHQQIRDGAPVDVTKPGAGA
ncbi:MAG: efflux RND transporter periplasmic adaptor subunit, partial [Burkholderiales bacterium]